MLFSDKLRVFLIGATRIQAQLVRSGSDSRSGGDPSRVTGFAAAWGRDWMAEGFLSASCTLTSFHVAQTLLTAFAF